MASDATETVSYTRTAPRRSEVIWGRVTPGDKGRIEAAAKELGTSISAVTAEGASRFAAEILAEAEGEDGD